VKRVSVEIDNDLHRWLTEYAKDGQTSVSAVVRFALEELRADCEDPAKGDWWAKWKKENR
jgi:Arc/MetJ-type ribon-helix-helix transcriptional regulator